MYTFFHKYIAQLTMFGVALGLFFGMAWGSNPRKTAIEGSDFIHEGELGSHMRILVTSPDLGSALITQESINTRTVKLNQHVEIFIPDQYATSTYGCFTTGAGETWFDGEFRDRTEIFNAVRQVAFQKDRHLAANFTADGSIFTCGADKQKDVLATGITLAIPFHFDSGATAFYKLTSYVSYVSVGADLYVTFLLMLFIPTLTLSLLRSVLDSAGAGTKYLRAIGYFVVSSSLAAAWGVVAALVDFKVFAKPAAFNTFDAARIKALDAGGLHGVTTYDPHPVLTQLGHLIPTNPLGALTDPNSTSGLQVAFIALVIGFIMTLLSEEHRKKISESLRHILALLVRDSKLQWRSLSDVAEIITPVGVFLVCFTVFATLSLDAVRELARLFIAILLALLAHNLTLLLWVRFRRNWRDWLKNGLGPSAAGIMTGFATASSYAALPGVTSVELVARDSYKRGVLDLGTTFNKNGTALYLACSAAFIVVAELHKGGGGLTVRAFPLLLSVILVATLAGIATAGLPFAAIFGLRMVLLPLGFSGGLAWLIFSIDPLIDRFVTASNVFSNVVACSDPKTRTRSRD